jgi:hypothetical protein
MLDRVHLFDIEILAGFLVAQESVVLPAVPQPGHHVAEFDGALVARGVIDVAVEAEIRGLVLRLRGHEVPAGAAAADMVDRQKLARDVIRVVVRRGAGRDEAEMRRLHRQRRQHAHRFEAHGPEERAAAISRGERTAARHGRRILKKDRIEPAALGRARDLGVFGIAHVGFGRGLRQSPAAIVRTGRKDEGGEMHPLWLPAHRAPSPLRSPPVLLQCEGQSRAEHCTTRPRHSGRARRGNKAAQFASNPCCVAQKLLPVAGDATPQGPFRWPVSPSPHCAMPLARSWR